MMKLNEALAKHDIRMESWKLFLALAENTLRVPAAQYAENKSAYRKRVSWWIKRTPRWAYIGGMRDALWAWVNQDRDAYDALEKDMWKAIDRITRKNVKA